MTREVRYVHSARGMGAFAAERREQLGLSQLELANRIGVSRSWVARFEGDSSTATLHRVVRALDELGVSLQFEFDPGEEAPSE